MKTEACKEYQGFFLILPNFVGFLVFTLGPVIAAFVIAFCRWKIIQGPEFIGIENFVNLIHDARFWKYTYNTLFLMLGIPISILGSLFLAVILNQKIRGVVAFRTIYYLPTISAGIALLILWKALLADTGLINKILALVGINGPNWLLNYFWAKPALILVNIWLVVGGNNMILYLAALTNINPELYEVADLDGASAWHKFWNITWPLVSPTTFFITVMSIIMGFQGNFETVFIMTKGGPAGSTTVLSYYIYEKAFVTYQMGYATAIALFLFAIILLFTLINWRFGGKVVHY